MKTICLILAVALTAGLASAATLQVSVPDLQVPGGTVGATFQVPIYVSVPDGAANQGLARLYVRLTSSDSANVIAPVPNGTRVTTVWDAAVAGYAAKLASTVRDLDSDGDADAHDAAVADVSGSNANRNLGIGGQTLVLTQTWQFVGTPTPGTAYKLHVVFPTTKGRQYNVSGQQVAFTTQTGIDGSVTVTEATTPTPTPSPTPTPIPGDANRDGRVNLQDLSALATNYGQTNLTGDTWAKGDFNDDQAVNLQDLSILASNYGTGGGSTNFQADYQKAFGTTLNQDTEKPPNRDAGLGCGTAALPLIAGLVLAGLGLGIRTKE